MVTSNHVNKICAVVVACMIVLSLLLIGAVQSGAIETQHDMAYEQRLFDTSRVHRLDLVVDSAEFDEMLQGATQKTYISCNVAIDGELYKNVAIRTKGNSSLSQVAASDSDRYSFKIEFDHYTDGKSYYGLDKLVLNNLVQDNSYLKDYFSYEIIRAAGGIAPLASFVYITVNNADWGLYLAVEGIEEGFVTRNYGTSGNLYKPDSMDLNNRNAEIMRGENMDEMRDWFAQAEGENGFAMPEGFEPPEGFEFPEGFSMPEGVDFAGGMPPGGEGFAGFGQSDGAEAQEQMPFGEDTAAQGGGPGGMRGGGMGGMGMGTSDTRLAYTDDAYESYANIFENAIFDITDADKDRLIASLKQLGLQENLDEVVNVEEVINYFAGHIFTLNGDSYTGNMIHNYYLLESDGQLSMIAWDYNLAFGGMQFGNDTTQLINSPIDTPTTMSMDSLPMISWIFADESYTQMYHDALDKLLTDYFESGMFAANFDSVVSLIGPYVEKDPTSFCTYEEFMSAAETLKAFCLLRAQSIRAQLSGDIPTTTEGQTADPSGLIDASSVDISQMGSMQMGMGRGGEGWPNMRRPSEGETP